MVSPNSQTERFYSDASEYFADLLDGIDSATKSIIVEFYMFRFDTLGKKVIQALVGAVERGVDVRVLIDGVGSSDDYERVSEVLLHHGVRTRIYHPLPWMLRGHSRALKKGSDLGRLAHFISRINNRDHRKLCIIDRDTLWTGSFNISQVHLLREAGGAGWRDYGIRLRGERVALIAETFDLLWHRKTSLIVLNSFRQVVSNITPRNRRRKYQFLLRKLLAAKQRIWITNAYFSPTQSILYALIKAAEKGIDVRILLPASSDVAFFPLLSASYYEALLAAGVRIFEYGDGFLHAKAQIIDEFYMLGSTNLNSRSLVHDVELDIVLLEAESRSAMEEQFLKDQAASCEIHASKSKFSLRQRALSWFIRLFRYWV